jgi:hypothetical protein
MRLDPPVPIPLRVIGRIASMPVEKRRPLRRGQSDAVTIRHVKADPRDIAADRGPRLRQPELLVHFEVAGAKTPSLAVDHGERVMPSCRVDRTHRRPEIVQILIGAAKRAVGLQAARPAAKGATGPVAADLPVPAGMSPPDPGRRHDMLDLDPLCPLVVTRR